MRFTICDSRFPIDKLKIADFITFALLNIELLQINYNMQDIVESLNIRFSNKSPEEVLANFLKEYKGKIALASSLGAEDQVNTKMIAEIDPSTKIFMLDTGRLFPQTYSLVERTKEYLNINIEIFFPDFELIESMVNKKGINLFYESIENRKECCHNRKTKPLKRALNKLDVWVCGLRRDQSVTRSDIQMVEWDEANGLLKLNPLINWSEKQVWDYIKFHNIPYNVLHDQGFPSIGCQPCTRAVEKGEDIRAGRWWWENPENKECGLHVRN